MPRLTSLFSKSCLLTRQKNKQRRLYFAFNGKEIHIYLGGDKVRNCVAKMYIRKMYFIIFKPVRSKIKCLCMPLSGEEGEVEV
jgi:hypothetical protein